MKPGKPDVPDPEADDEVHPADEDAGAVDEAAAARVRAWLAQRSRPRPPEKPPSR